MRVFRTISKIWDTLLALAIGVGCARLLPQSSLRDITTEVITFFAIQSAVILPAMILTAGLLRSDGVSISEARQYHHALRLQMRFWVTLLALDFVAVCLLIVGKAIDWRLSLEIVVYHLNVSLNVGAPLMGATCFVVSLCVFRMIPFVQGVMSLLEMNGRLVEKSILERERRSAEQLELSRHQPLEPPPNYGQINPH